MFVLNYSSKKVTIELKKELCNLYTGEKEVGKIELEAYETRVYS